MRLGRQMLKPAVHSSSTTHPDTHSPAPWHAACVVVAPDFCSSHTVGYCLKLTFIVVTWGSTNGLKCCVLLTYAVAECECKSVLSFILQQLWAFPKLLAKCTFPLGEVPLQLWYSQLLPDRCHAFLNLTFLCSAFEKAH